MSSYNYYGDGSPQFRHPGRAHPPEHQPSPDHHCALPCRGRPVGPDMGYEPNAFWWRARAYDYFDYIVFTLSWRSPARSSSSTRLARNVDDSYLQGVRRHHEWPERRVRVLPARCTRPLCCPTSWSSGLPRLRGHLRLPARPAPDAAHDGTIWLASWTFRAGSWQHHWPCHWRRSDFHCCWSGALGRRSGGRSSISTPSCTNP